MNLKKNPRASLKTRPNKKAHKTRRAQIFFNGTLAGFLEHDLKNLEYRFEYETKYQGPPISLTMPLEQKKYEFNDFPPFFDGLLPEGPQLEGLLRQNKIDRRDYFSQLLAVGADLVGAVTIMAVE